MPRYITVGNTVIDHLVVPDGRQMPSQLGGDAIYSAMGVRVWSQDVGIVSIIGRSFPSEWTDGLASAGIDVSGIKRRAFPINLEGRIIYNPDGSRTWGPPEGILGIAVRLFPRLFLALGPRLSLAFSPQAADIPESYYGAAGAHMAPMAVARQAECLEALHGHVGIITLDLLPILPGVLRKGERPYIPDLTLVTAVLPSEQEIAEYFGPVSIEEGAQRLASEGARMVLVKLGEQGSLVYEAESKHWWQIPIYPTKVKDPTGAGDAYCGGFLVGLDETGDPFEAALYGTVSASFIIEGFGALYSSEVTRADAEARLHSMRTAVKRTNP